MRDSHDEHVVLVAVANSLSLTRSVVDAVHLISDRGIVELRPDTCKTQVGDIIFSK